MPSAACGMSTACAHVPAACAHVSTGGPSLHTASRGPQLRQGPTSKCATWRPWTSWLLLRRAWPVGLLLRAHKRLRRHMWPQMAGLILLLLLWVLL